MTPEISRLSGVVLKVLLALGNHASPEQPWAWPTIETLAAYLGARPWKVRAWLAKAEEAGFIVKWRRKYAHASFAYDMRRFYAAMGWPEALEIGPPDDAHIGTPLRKSAVSTPLRKSAVHTAEKVGAKARGESQRPSPRRNAARSSEAITGTDKRTDQGEETSAPAAPLPAPARVSVNPRNGDGQDDGQRVSPRQATIGELREAAREARVLRNKVEEFIETHPDLTPTQIGSFLDHFLRHIHEANSPTGCFLSAVKAVLKPTPLAVGAP